MQDNNQWSGEIVGLKMALTVYVVVRCKDAAREELTFSIKRALSKDSRTNRMSLVESWPC